MFDWWMELPGWLRVGVGAVLLILGVALMAAPLLGFIESPARGLFRTGLVMFCLGVAAVIMGGSSSAERHGYRF